MFRHLALSSLTMACLVGCGSSSTSTAFAPAQAQTAPAPSSGAVAPLQLGGKLHDGSGSFALFLQTVEGTAFGEGMVVRGDDIQPVAVRGNVTGSHVCLDLVPDDQAPETDLMRVDGDVSGNGGILFGDGGNGYNAGNGVGGILFGDGGDGGGVLFERATGLSHLALLTDETQPTSKARLLNGQPGENPTNPEVFEFRLQPRQQPPFTVFAEVSNFAGPGVSSGKFTGRWSTDVDIGPAGQQQGKLEVLYAQFDGKRPVAEFKFVDRAGLALRIITFLPEDLRGASQNCDLDSAFFDIGGSAYFLQSARIRVENTGGF